MPLTARTGDDAQMTHRRPYFAGFDLSQAIKTLPFGVSLPMAGEIARGCADHAISLQVEVAQGATRENSQVMASSVTPADACNCVFRYPSQCSWPGIVPTAPAALSFFPYFLRENAQIIADPRRISVRRLPLVKTMTCSPRIDQGTKGKSRCDFLKLRRSHVSPLVALRPVATRRWNRVSLAPVPVQARPSLRVATPQPVRLSVQASIWRTARPTQKNATNLTSAPLRAQPMNRTIKAHLGLGGFLLSLSARDARADHEPEGTFDVQ